MNYSIIKKLELKNPPVAIKFYLSKPEGYEQLDRQMGLCQMVTYAQKAPKPFYMTKENENCFGKIALGMQKIDPVTHSGQVGYLYNVFDDPRVNAKLYHSVPLHDYKTVNYVVFARLDEADFDPDLVVVMADMRQAELIMRAMSYTTGEIWESKSTSVLGCSWMFAYTYLMGKVNMTYSGMYFGMRRRKAMDPGWHVITIPYQWLGTIVANLEKMPWVPYGWKDDPESLELYKNAQARMAEMRQDPEFNP